ncbi:MAG: phosphatase PAP2 family protein [Candidatus Kerfeldbacteria bacterium]|nr:phosphatase PAP2 family protein [Candidatus Kerfeldbacteria bacterium]
MIDQLISQSLYWFVANHQIIKLFAIFCASVLIWLLLAWFVIVYIWHKKAWQGELVALLLGVASAYGLNALVGWYFFRLRPFVALQLPPLINMNPLSKSFPSDHATVAFLFAYLLSAHKKSYRPLALVLAVLVSWGRLAVGVHYLTDVLAGAFIGSLLGWGTRQLEKILVTTNK